MKNNPLNNKLIDFTDELDILCERYGITLTHPRSNTLYIVDDKTLDYCELMLSGGFEDIY